MATKSVAQGDFYNRIGAVALLTAKTEDGAWQGQLESFEKASIYNGLNFRFRFRQFSDDKQGVKGEGAVGILGLSRETIRAWASAIEPSEYRKKKRFVRVYAGYEHDGDLSKCELFTGWITGGQPSSPPEMWLNFDIQQGSAALSNMVSASQGLFLAGAFTIGAVPEKKGDGTPLAWRSGYGKTIKDACEVAVQALQSGLRVKHTNKTRAPSEVEVLLDWRISSDLEHRMPKLRAVDFSSKKAKEIVAEINSWSIVRAELKLDFEPIGDLDAIATRMGKYGENQYVIDDQRVVAKAKLVIEPNFANWDFKTNIKSPVRLDQDSGMIGIPKFGLNGEQNSVTVKCLMRRDIAFGDLIEPVSQYMESPFKYYQVNEITYEGEFRGQPWYVTYKGIGISAQESEMKKKMIEAARAKARADKIRETTVQQQAVGQSVTGYVQQGVGSTASEAELKAAEDEAEKKLREQWALKYGKDV